MASASLVTARTTRSAGDSQYRRGTGSGTFTRRLGTAWLLVTGGYSTVATRHLLSVAKIAQRATALAEAQNVRSPGRARLT